MLRGLAIAIGVVCCVWCFGGSAAGQYVQYERAPIDYLNAEVDDAVSRLAAKLESGEVELTFEDGVGYLPAVLAALDVPVESQTLVFSKTSLQLQRISPRRPRAIYFNDSVYVGFCQRGDVLEFAVTDAKQGATFYTLEQDPDAEPRIVRDRGACLSCHATNRTQGVPGYLVRSVFADAAGRPKLGSGTFTTDHTSPFRERWGGWYVTGEHGAMRHMGNTICRGDDISFDREPGANDVDLSDNFRTDAYLTPHSDIVALMVLEHQTQMHNAIALANYDTRIALHQLAEMNEILERPRDHVTDSVKRRVAASATRVLHYLLFCDEFKLESPVRGTTSFASDFERRGIRDSHGRSLRTFDLERRLFRYPCSYLIHSEAFAALPDMVRGEIMQRLVAILRGRDESPEYAHLDASVRRELCEILGDTLPEFSEYLAADGKPE